MSKKLITLLLAASLMSTALASCGGNSNNGEDTSADDTTVEDTTIAEEKAASIDELADAVTGAYGDLYDANNEMGMPLSTYRASFAENVYELNIPGFENPTEEDLGMPVSEYISMELENLYGIQNAWVDEFVMKKAASMTNVDTLLIVKPTEGNEENVLNALTAYHDFLANDAFQYPINLPKIRNAKAFAEGGYVFFVMLGTLPDELVYVDIDYENLTEDEIAAEQAKIDAAQDEYAASNTQKAIDTISAILGK